MAPARLIRLLLTVLGISIFALDVRSEAPNTTQLERQYEKVVKRLIERLNDEDEGERNVAAAALANLGPAATSAVPALIEALKSRLPLRSPFSGGSKTGWDRSPLVAREALVRMGRPALPLLEKALKHHDALTRVHSASAIWQITNDTKLALPVLLKDWRDCELDRVDLCIRNAATETIGEMSRNHADMLLPIVLRALADDTEMGGQVCRVLTIMGRHDKRAVKHLYDLMSTDGNVYWFAARGLRQLKSAGVPHLIDGLRSDNSKLRSRCAWAVGGMESRYVAVAIPELENCLKDNSPTVREAAASALTNIKQRRFDHGY